MLLLQAKRFLGALWQECYLGAEVSSHRRKQEGKKEKRLEKRVYMPQMQVIFLRFWELLQIRIIAGKASLSFCCPVIEQLQYRGNLQDA